MNYSNEKTNQKCIECDFCGGIFKKGNEIIKKDGEICPKCGAYLYQIYNKTYKKKGF